MSFERGVLLGLEMASRCEDGFRDFLGTPSFTVELPLKLTNASNGSHGHWAEKSKSAEEQRTAARLACKGFAPFLGEKRWVLVTRLAPSGGLDPHDGLRRSAKHVVDGIADALGLKNDRDPRVVWLYAQGKSGKRGVYGVRIEMF